MNYWCLNLHTLWLAPKHLEYISYIILMLLLPLITSQVSKFNLFPFIRQCACCSIIIIFCKSFTLLFVSTRTYVHRSQSMFVIDAWLWWIHRCGFRSFNCYEVGRVFLYAVVVAKSLAVRGYGKSYKRLCVSLNKNLFCATKLFTSKILWRFDVRV